MADFLSRWNLPVNAQEEQKRLRSRFAVVFRDHLSCTDEPLAQMAHAFNIRAGLALPRREAEAHRGLGVTEIVGVILGARTFGELYFLTECLLRAMAETNYADTDKCQAEIQRAIDLSASANVRIVFEGDVLSLYPKGARLLDKAVVDETLSWLAGRSDVAQEFQKALKAFEGNDASKYRQVCEGLRFSLEALLRGVLGNNKPLEGQNRDLLSWFADRGVHQKVVNMLAGVIDILAQYSNAWAKHPGDHEPGTAEMEYVIYQTATLMRLILELERESKGGGKGQEN